MQRHMTVPDGLRGQRLAPSHLRDWPLPPPDPEGDKEDRGRVLLIAGSRELPGAAQLAAMAALRAGAGKLTLATGQSVARGLALALPEARVLALPETAAGGLDLTANPEATSALLDSSGRADAVLVGPGLMDTPATCALVRALLATCAPKPTGTATHTPIPTPMILDALAMDALVSGVDGAAPGLVGTPVLLTPHAGEMAHLMDMPKTAVQAEPEAAAQAAAARLGAAVALKGPCTWLVNTVGQGLRHEGGSANLAASGSGDVLAGLIAGLCARGAPLMQAAAWAVWLHAHAGRRLARQHGELGSLASELPPLIPGLMQRWQRPRYRRGN